MNERTAEFLRAERERYEYLLACASDAEHEELAWETIVARMTVEDFVTAAKEVLAAREVIKAAPPPFLLRALADWLDLETQRRGWQGDQVQRDLHALADALAASGRPAAADQPPGDG